LDESLLQPSSSSGRIENMILLATQVSTFAAQDLLWGGAIPTYPDQKIAWSEAGIGWIPSSLDRCDLGAACRNRTDDLLITSEMLYRLS
jgi:hypothetical protein